MLRVLALLLLLPLRLAAGDAGEACARLADADPEAVRRAVEDLRRAGPEADAPLRALLDSEAPEASLAGAILAARRFDPEIAVTDLEVFLLLASSDPEARRAGASRAVVAGSAVSGRLLARWMDAASEDDLCRGLETLASGPGRDPGWAREALRHLGSRPLRVRNPAALALGYHSVRGLAGDIRLALEAERDSGVRLRLWAALMSATLEPGDLPALPEEAEELASVLSLLAGTHGPELRLVIWPRIAGTGPGTMERLLWDDPARLGRLLGPDGALDIARRAGGRSRFLAPDLRVVLGDDADPGVRRALAPLDGFTPQEIVRGAAFLGDPDESVRLSALRSFDRWTRERQPRPAGQRIESALCLAAALRTCLDAAAGPGSTGEIEWAVRHLLDVGGESGPVAGAAYQALWLVHGEAGPVLAGLEGDPDAGGAARRVARLLRLGVPPDAAQFPRGLDGAARVRAGWVSGLDAETWGAMLSSDDAEEKQLALGLLGDAWDRIDQRAEITKRLVEVAGGQDAATAQAALAFLLSARPQAAPERPELDSREGWTRPRRYVVERLRALAAAPGPLDRQKASQIGMLGDRTSVLAALRGGRADDPAVLGGLLQDGRDLAFVPALLDGFEAASDSSRTMTWFHALAGSGPTGARVVAAFARDASRQARVPATAVLLSRAWCDPLTVPLLGRAALDAESRAVTVEALRFTPIRNRPPLSPPCATALSAFLLALAREDAARPDLERIVGTLGDGLRDADAATMDSLAANETLLSLARAAGIPLGRTGTAYEQIFRGDRNARSAALSRLPADSLLSISLACLSSLRCGSTSDFPEYYALEKSRTLADVALLARAADEPESREELLRLRRHLRRWNAPSDPPAESIRVVECPVPAEFDGPSARARQAAVARARPDSSTTILSLAAAAFRGAPGDELALGAVLPRLGPDALPRLLPLLNAPDTGARAAGARTVGTLGLEAPGFARAGLRASLEGEEDRAARAAKLAALLTLGDPEGAAGLRTLSTSSDPDDRLAAARALGVARGREALEGLADLAQDGDFVVRSTAGDALVSLTRRKTPPDMPPWEAADWRTWLREHPEARG
ncbi:MAG: HEAT repeat domain-containing protein, partial [Planctomycetia bacterium]|nr:HEAT repeat domain-containing protein [Planctomycetia bacterium]